MMSEDFAKSKLHVAVLEPYYGGSHAIFVDTLVAHSRHHIRLATMPARKWKWRMRGAAIWFAQDDTAWRRGGVGAILANDMLSIADLRALLPPETRDTPIVCYFHENQLTYPLSEHDTRDYQYGMTNITSALAADENWFNSRSHLEAFLSAAAQLLRQMPDCVPGDVIEQIRTKSRVEYPGVEEPPSMDQPPKIASRDAISTAQGPKSPAARRSGSDAARDPVRILWCHRWEYDKNPEPFFSAVLALANQGRPFELVLLGEQFRVRPPVFAESWPRIQPHIAHVGFVASREDYWSLISSCHVVVSTAIQENFGIAIAEAILAGCQPLLPSRLSYPELLPPEYHAQCLYERDDQLRERLMGLVEPAAASSHLATRLSPVRLQSLRDHVQRRFAAGHRVAEMDSRLSAIGERTPGR